MESTKKSSSATDPGGLTALIIDDEQGAINSLRHMLREYCPIVQSIFAANTVNAAVSMAAEVRPELVFLDIEMPPFGNGFDFLDQCGNNQFGVIFTTAYPQYAIQAINTIQPWAYLVKPFSVSELKAAVEVARNRIRSLRMLSEAGSSVQGLVLHDSRKGNIVIRAGEIVYCEADGSFTVFVYQRDQKMEKFIASGHLGEYEAQLPAYHFCRTHHSFLVNMMFVNRLERTGRNGVLHLAPDNRKINVSVSQMGKVINRLKSYWGANFLT